jgi:hypothetical protein
MLILAAGGGANQGGVILISWAAALLIIALALIARRIKSVLEIYPLAFVLRTRKT